MKQDVRDPTAGTTSVLSEKATQPIKLGIYHTQLASELTKRYIPAFTIHFKQLHIKSFLITNLTVTVTVTTCPWS